MDATTMAEQTSWIIETRNLCKTYPVPKSYRELILHPFSRKEHAALENVSVRIAPKEIFGLLGPNGSGKTTLLKILSSLILPTSGYAAIHGLDIVRCEKEAKQFIGIVVNDERSFFWRLNGWNNLLFFATLNEIPKQTARQRIGEIASLLGLEDQLNRKFQEYSTGTRQKMAIARGLLTDPEILFMDEPTRSLDPEVASGLRRFVRDVLVNRFGKTVFLATNNMQEASEICDRVAVIHKGRVRQCGTIRELRHLFSYDRQYVVTAAAASDTLASLIRESAFAGTVKEIQPDESNAQFTRITLALDSHKQDIAAVVEWLIRSGIPVHSCIPDDLPLDELFVRSIHE